MKSGNLNFLELSGPLQACNGTDLPFILPFTYRVMHSLQKSRRPDEIRSTHLLNMSLEFQRPPLQPVQSQDSYFSTKIPYSPNIKGS